MPKEERPVLSVEDARERILRFCPRLESEELPITQALGRVLAQDIRSDINIPPLTNSAMDGFAVRANDITMEDREEPDALAILSGQVDDDLPTLTVVGELAAGAVWEGEIGPGQALRIMTGAPLPAGADTVVRFEDTETDGDQVTIKVSPQLGRNVRLAGEDVHEGELVLSRGMTLRPQEIGMLASVGYPTVRVYRAPRVAILATGDEVWPIDQPLEPGKIRNINSYALAAQVQELGGDPYILSIAPDREDALVDRLQRALVLEADLIVSSGGVSAGDFDLVKQVLSTEGKMDFWWVNMKPGRPMAFGLLDDIPLLALPGNPVAAMISFYLFGRPAIQKMMGKGSYGFPTTQARMATAIKHKNSRRHYYRVVLELQHDELYARMTGDQGSGILMSMVQADGLAVIPENVDHLDAGSLVDVLLFS